MLGMFFMFQLCFPSFLCLRNHVWVSFFLYFRLFSCLQKFLSGSSIICARNDQFQGQIIHHFLCSVLFFCLCLIGQVWVILHGVVNASLVLNLISKDIYNRMYLTRLFLYGLTCEVYGFFCLEPFSYCFSHSLWSWKLFMHS